MSWSQIPTFIRDTDGQGKQIAVVNPDKDFIQPFELPIDKPNQIVTLAAGQRAGPFPLTAQRDGAIEVFYIKATVYDNAAQPVPQTDYNIRFLLEHPGKRIQFSNRDVPLIALSGDGGRPYILPETIFIPAVQSLMVTFQNDDLANARRVEFVLGGIKFYHNSAPQKTRDDMLGYVLRRERTYAFFQTTDADVSLTALQTGVPGFMTVPDDGDLEVFKLTAQSTGHFRAQVKDGRNARGITGNKLHSSLLFGGHQAVAAGGGLSGSGGVFASRWATSFLARRSMKFELEFDDLSNAVNLIRPVFAGRKIKYAT
jgi:hypothetical protein